VEKYRNPLVAEGESKVEKYRNPLIAEGDAQSVSQMTKMSKIF
jgi:hypothetical protein